jgi:AbrB family looped-hinge helix DNA binding protein
VIEAKLSSKNQIVVPKEARDALKAKPGDRLLVVVRGETVILLNKPKKYSIAIRGLARKPYPKRYLKKERDSWK